MELEPHDNDREIEMEITRTQLDEILDALVNLGVNVGEDSIREDYSGRYMYGKTCLGIVLQSYVEIAKLAMALQTVLGDSPAADIVDHLATDSMGLSMIAYFPGVTLEDDDEN